MFIYLPDIVWLIRNPLKPQLIAILYYLMLYDNHEQHIFIRNLPIYHIWLLHMMKTIY